MRDIKFRIWDKRKKKWTTLYSDFSPLWHISYINDNTLSALINHQEKQDLVLQQFTGLKDKENKDIYEGDILLAGPIDFEIISEKDGVRHVDTSKPLPILDAPFYLGKVEYHPAEFSLRIIKNLRLNDSRGVASINLIPMSYSFEIIGNIFENPDLCGS